MQTQSEWRRDFPSSARRIGVFGLSVAFAYIALNPQPQLVGQVQVESSPEQSDKLKQAQIALNNRETSKALDLLTELVNESPSALVPRYARAPIASSLRKFDLALEDYNIVVKHRPEDAKMVRLRAGVRFKMGDVKGSIDDFLQAAKIQPELDRQLWDLGISYYYAGEYAKGAQQFEKYQAYYAADVENIVWRYLCEAKTVGPAKAQENMMRLEGTDRRVPMMAIDALYRGKCKPEEVLAAVRRDDPDESALKQRMFYAHLYLGLYFDSRGKSELARHHLEQAEKRVISHYMWDVAHIHMNMVRADEASERPATDSEDLIAPADSTNQ